MKSKLRCTFLSFFFSLVLISCSELSPANLLNDKLGFGIPTDARSIMVYADNGTSLTFKYQLKNNFKWGRDIVSFNEMMKDSEFKSWYEGLQFLSYSKMGITTDNSNKVYTGDESLVLYEGESCYIVWNNPIEYITIETNYIRNYYYSNDSEQIENKSFNYFLPEPLPYGEEKELAFETILKNKDFRDWYENLEAPAYCKQYPDGFSEYKGSSIRTDRSTISRWKRTLYLAWFDDERIWDFTIHSNNPDYPDFIYGLGYSITSLDMDWNDLINNVQFLEWFGNLENDISFPLGVASFKGKEPDVYEPYWSINENNVYQRINISPQNRDYYIQWQEYIQEFWIHGNNDAYDSEVFLFKVPGKNKTLTVSGEDFANNSEFMLWYDYLENDNLSPVGLSIDQYNYYYDIPNPKTKTGYVEIPYNDSDIYVQWQFYFSEIRIHGNNGELPEKIYKYPVSGNPDIKYMTWLDFSSDSGFIDWYNNLSNEGKIPAGLAYYENAGQRDIISPENLSSLSFSINQCDLYVQWKDEEPGLKIYANNGTDSYFLMDLGSDSGSKNLTWNDLYTYPGFWSWYSSLYSGSLYTCGLTYDYSEDVTPRISQFSINESMTVLVPNDKLKVCWGSYIQPESISIHWTGPDEMSRWTSYSAFVSIYPLGATVNNITFDIYDTTVADVSSTGLVTALRDGATTLNVSVYSYGNVLQKQIPVYVSASSEFSMLSIPEEIYGVDSMFVSADSSIIYLYANNSLYKTYDEVNWTKTTPTGYMGFKIGMSPNGKYICGINNNEVYISSDYGNTINSFYSATVVPSGMRDSSSKDVKISDDGRVIAAIICGGYGGLYRDVLMISSDSGLNWNCVNPESDKYVSSCSINSDGSKIVYVKDRILYCSSDYGETVNEYFSVEGGCQNCFISQDGNTLLLNRDNELYISSDFGNTFTLQSPVSEFIGELAVSPSLNSLVKFDSDHIQISTDMGQTWSEMRKRALSEFMCVSDNFGCLLYGDYAYNSFYLYKWN